MKSTKGSGPERAGRRDAGPFAQSTANPHRNMCTKAALLILALLCLDQALSVERERKEAQFVNKIKEKKPNRRRERSGQEAELVLDGYNCEGGANQMFKLPKHEDCKTGDKGMKRLREWKGQFALLQKRRTKDIGLLTCSLRMSIMEGHCGTQGSLRTFYCHEICFNLHQTFLLQIFQSLSSSASIKMILGFNSDLNH